MFAGAKLRRFSMACFVLGRVYAFIEKETAALMCALKSVHYQRNSLRTLEGVLVVCCQFSQNQVDTEGIRLESKFMLENAS